MLKLKFSFFAFTIALTLSIFTACNNEDSYLPPNQDIVNAFKQLYPMAQNIEWSQKGIYYVADCWADGSELDVWFDANANWVMTEEEIYLEQLPATVYTSFQEGIYASWVIDDLTKILFPQQGQQFVLEVQQGGKEMALYYSADGGLLHQRDITDADDTHWPEITGLPI